MKTLDVGASLRQARKAKGLSLSQLSNKTKISVSMLQALEMNDAAKLPADVFARGFLRAYAREVGLDPDDTVEGYLAQFEPAVEEDASAAETTDHRRRERHAESAPGSPGPRAFPIDVRLQTVVGVAVVILLVSYFGLRGWQARDDGDDTGVAEASGGSDVARAALPDPATPVERAVAPAPAPLVAGEVLRLEFTPMGPCWVSISTDGSRPVSRLMQPGEKTTIEFRTDVNLRVGDAGVFTYTIDGLPGRALGGAGQPVTVQITRDNFRDFLTR